MSSFSLSQRVQEINWLFIGLVLLLAGIGIAMMISAGGGDLREFAVPQIIRLLIAIVLMFTVALIPQEMLYRYAYHLYLIGIVALVGVDILGHTGMGAKRWISFGGMNLQPSEFMKLAVILALARFFHSTYIEDIQKFMFLIPPLLMLAIPAVLVLRQPNLGTTIVTVAVGGVICFMAGVRLRYFICAIMAVCAAAPVAWRFMHEYQKQRVLTFLNPSEDPLGAGYNILQSMIAIGSGGALGKGFMNGSQGQLNFLPEKHTDFIFTMFAEEWGFFGSMILLAFYVLLMAFGLFTAVNCRTQFASLVAAGVTFLVFIHVFINVAMVMGMVPVVGLPLPFLSYGGSIMFSAMMGMGLLLNAHINRDRALITGRKDFR